MHFRVRKNVVQLVRTNYERASGRPRAEVVGRVPLSEPALGSELVALLTADELREFDAWVAIQHRSMRAREEYAALTLAETLELAERWFARAEETPLAVSLANQLAPQWKSLKRTLKARGFSE